MRCAVLAVLAMLSLGASVGLGAGTGGQAARGTATNIDPAHRQAWTENAGWLAFRSEDGTQGVRVLPTVLAGLAWAENAGWIHLGDGTPGLGSAYANEDGADFGVNVDPVSGNLFGLAWGENIGWLNFDTKAVLGSSGLQARVDFPAGRLRGFAWAENVGWINLDGIEPFVGFVWPACRDPFADADADGDVDQVDFASLQRCLSVGAGIPDGCECFNRPEFPGFPRGDNDIDADDWDAFVGCALGPGIASSIDCDD